jgi:hypothetical protein
MRIELRFGSRVGEVVDFPPYEARAMVADGRATIPVDRQADPDHVEHRTDRGMPRSRKRVTR